MSLELQKIPEPVVEGICSALVSSTLLDSVLFWLRFQHGYTLETLGSASLLSANTVRFRIDDMTDDVRENYESSVAAGVSYVVSLEDRNEWWST